MTALPATRRKRYATDPKYRALAISRATAYYKSLPLEVRRNKSRTWNLANKYGITPACFDALFAKQDGVCAICKRPETRKNQYGPVTLSVDHCHTSGKVRGLLCVRCNQGIGQFKDNVTALRAAAEYLEKETK